MPSRLHIPDQMISAGNCHSTCLECHCIHLQRYRDMENKMKVKRKNEIMLGQYLIGLESQGKME